MPMKIHLPPDSAIRSTSSSSRSRLALICPTQASLRAGGDDVAQQRLGALHVDGEVVVDEEDGDLPVWLRRARFQQQQLVHDALVGAEADGVAEETGDGAELAAIGAAAAGLDGNDVKRFPLARKCSMMRAHEAGNAVELVDVERVPRDLRVTLEVGFALLAERVDRHIYFLECAAGGVGDDLRPGFIGFAEGHGIGMARAAIAAQRLVGQFGDVRSAHDHRDAGGAKGVGHAVSFGDHAGHGADPHQPDALGEHEAHDLGVGHGLSVAVDQQHFVSGRGERLEQKHPKVRHEVLRSRRCRGYTVGFS